jgi:hypothetical protein
MYYKLKGRVSDATKNSPGIANGIFTAGLLLYELTGIEI